MATATALAAHRGRGTDSNRVGGGQSHFQQPSASPAVYRQTARSLRWQASLNIKQAGEPGCHSDTATPKSPPPEPALPTSSPCALPLAQADAPVVVVVVTLTLAIAMAMACI